MPSQEIDEVLDLLGVERGSVAMVQFRNLLKSEVGGMQNLTTVRLTAEFRLASDCCAVTCEQFCLAAI
jgi:hypothetical protein